MIFIDSNCVLYIFLGVEGIVENKIDKIYYLDIVFWQKEINKNVI